MWLRGVRLLDLTVPPRRRGPRGSDPSTYEYPVVDLHIHDGRIAQIAPASTWDGTWVMPGLWDHHVHMSEWARTFHRLDLSSTTTPAEALAKVQGAAAPGSPLLATGTLVGIGLWHSRWEAPFDSPGGPTRADLDAVTGDLPTVLISGDLHSAWFNSAAARRYHVDDSSDVRGSGLVREEDWFSRLPDVAGDDDARVDGWVAEAAAHAAARGVVGIMDFEFHDTHAAWRRRVEGGFSRLRVGAAVWPEHLDAAITAGHRTGDALTPEGLIRMGPLKIISDGSLNTRTAWCADPYPDGSLGAPNLAEGQLRDLMQRAHRGGIRSAIHAIGDRSGSAALRAFRATGASGSIEHAQLLRDEDVHAFAELGVTASVQPAHLLDDRDTAEALWPGRTHRAYRFADLVRAGADLHFGSDAPVAPLDPWLAIRAACTRTADHRPAWHVEQILDRLAALRASVAVPSLTERSPADLVVLDADPLTFPAEDLREIPVRQTLCAGKVTFENS